MNETFKVGEVAIYWRPESPSHGVEVTIIGPLEYFPKIRDVPTGKIIDGYRYTVSGSFPSPGKNVAAPEHLRKKRPPQELSSWDKVQEICGWNPQKQVCRS